MAGAPFDLLRRRLALAGVHVASAPAERVAGRTDTPAIRPARLLEGAVRAVPVGPPVPWEEAVGFLDGVQHVALVGYDGTDPILAADVGAAVRLRVARRPGTAVVRRERIVVARATALERLAGAWPDGVRPVALADDEPPHPLADADRARAAVDHARTALEIAAAAAFRAEHPDTWLLVDGSLATAPDWATDPRMLGIVKSHATLPFSGSDLHAYLTLPAGHRTTLFAPETRRVAPVHAWGLRLHDWRGRDLFHGLVRVEARADDATAAQADRLSAHLLAERAPVAADPRADRLLYGIHDVERALRAGVGGG